MDDKKAEKRSFSESKVTLINRSNLAITGVEKVVSATSTIVNLVVSGAPMSTEGSNLYVSKLDVEQGVIVLEGQICAIRYDQNTHKPLFKRMFK